MATNQKVGSSNLSGRAIIPTKTAFSPLFGRDASLCPRAEAKKKGRSAIRGTQESDRTASLAPAQVEVRTGAVLSSGGCAEPRAAGAVPGQASPADRNRLNEETKKRTTRPTTARSKRAANRSFSTDTPDFANRAVLGE